jgi:tRNA 2-thiocytidine biosynthesis protein TtcA
LESMLSALQNVVPSHLMDRKLYPFETIQTTGMPVEDGDIAFDDEPLPVASAPSIIRVRTEGSENHSCSTA